MVVSRSASRAFNVEFFCRKPFAENNKLDRIEGGHEMYSYRNSQLLKFLQDDLDVSNASISVALKHWHSDPGPLPILLWQYGFVTLEQLDQIYEWLENEDLEKPEYAI